MNSAKKALWGISCGHFILDMYASILVPLYPLIAQKHNINLALMSTVIAIGYFLSSILQPLWGYISDKINIRFFMFWGLILASVFMPLFYTAPSKTILTLFLILGMMGNAFYHPQATLIIKNFYKQKLELSKAIGIFLAFGTIGYSLGPYLSSFIVKKFDSYFMCIALIGVIFAFTMLFFVPKIEKIQTKTSLNFLISLKDILKNKTCMLLIFFTVLKACLLMSFSTYIPFLLKQYNFEIVHVGFIMTAFFILGSIAMMFASYLEKRIKLKGLIIVSYLPLLPLIIFALLSLKFSLKYLAVICFVLIGFFVLLAAGSILANAQKIIPNSAGIISGIIQGFTLAIGSLLLIPLGIIAQKFGISYVLVLICVISASSAIYCHKTKLLANL